MVHVGLYRKNIAAWGWCCLPFWKKITPPVWKILDPPLVDVIFELFEAPNGLVKAIWIHFQ